MTTPSSPFQLSLLTSEEEFASLEPEWNSFLRESRSDSIFLTWEYLSIWWEVYGADYDLRVLLAQDEDGAWVGIAPLMIGRGHSFPRRHFRHLTFLGGLGDSLAEYQDFIIRPGWETCLVPAFLRFVEEDLAEEWDVLLLRDTDERSPNLLPLMSAVAARGPHAAHLSSRASPHIPLPDSWDAYLESKSKNFRKQFKNQWNRLHKHDSVEWLEAGRDLPVSQAMTILAELNRERWGDRGDTFRSEQFTRFHRRLAECFQERGWLFLRILRLNGGDVAARYDFVYGNKLWNYQNGWRPETGNLSLGKLFLGYSLQHCVREGIREYDFLGGESPYKLSWATASRDLVRVEIPNPSRRYGYVLHQLQLLRGLVHTRRVTQGEAA